MDCLICLDCKDTELYNNNFACECKVFFHKKCFEDYFSLNKFCPFCRKFKPENKPHIHDDLYYTFKLIFSLEICFIIVIALCCVLEGKTEFSELPWKFLRSLLSITFQVLAVLGIAITQDRPAIILESVRLVLLFSLAFGIVMTPALFNHP